jgi:hypothetical protein
MTIRLRAPQDLAAGLVFMAFAAAFRLGGRHYETGSAASMDAGYMPMLLSTLLFILGAACATRAVLPGRAAEARIGRLPLRAVSAVAGAVILFALTLDHIGFPLAMFASLVTVSFGARLVRPVEAVVTAALLTAFGWFVFIRLLGIQFPMGPF